MKKLRFINSGKINYSLTEGLNLYSTVIRLTDVQNDYTPELFNCYIKTIEEYIDYVCNYINNQETGRLVDAFLEVSEKSKILIYRMIYIFRHLDKCYTNNVGIGSLCVNGMKVFYNKLFNPFIIQLSDALTKMIEDDMDAKVVARNKITKLLKIFEENDIKNPEIKKDGENMILI